MKKEIKKGSLPLNNNALLIKRIEENETTADRRNRGDPREAES